MKSDLQVLREGAFGVSASRVKTTIVIPAEVANGMDHICQMLGLPKNAMVILALSELVAGILAKHGDFVGTDAERRLLLREIQDRVVAITRAFA